MTSNKFETIHFDDEELDSSEEEEKQSEEHFAL